MDDFVIQAEQLIYRLTDLPVTRAVDDGNKILTAGTNTITLPSNWLEVFNLSLKEAGAGDNETKPLYRKDESYIREVYPVSTVTGEPRDWAVLTHTTILVGPTPDASYPLLIYYKRFPETIVTAGVTWLSTNCEQALLWGSIYNAYLFLKGDPDLLATYEKKFLMELQALGYHGDDIPQDRVERT